MPYRADAGRCFGMQEHWNRLYGLVGHVHPTIDTNGNSHVTLPNIASRLSESITEQNTYYKIKVKL